MKTRLVSVLIALAAVVAPLVAAGGAHGAGYLPLLGSFHEHSGYSDGWPGSTPATYFRSAADNGLDFLFGGEHSDNWVLPVAFSHYCTDDPARSLSCTTSDSDKVAQALKWQAQLDQANAATTGSFTAGRGFEWTADVYGHLGVYMSSNDENAKTDAGYGVTMETFWSWFTRAAALGGGADGIGTFNHPGGKCSLGKTDPTCNWNQFAYVPGADDRMVGIELFNYNDANYDKYYTQALDAGWHVGAIGAEDVGHDTPDVWGAAKWPKTVVLATGRSLTDVRAALLARRFYATRQTGLTMDFRVNGAIMGARMSVAPGDAVTIDASTSDPALALDVVTSGGLVVATGTGSIHTTVTATAGQKWYYVRARLGLMNFGYSSPVWVNAA